jgi:hypothetical protein
LDVSPVVLMEDVGVLTHARLPAPGLAYPPHCHVTAVTSVTRRGYLDHHHVNERRALDVPGFSPLKPSIPSPAVDAIAGPGAYPLLRGPQAADPT